jgi:hypothetical protein
MMASSSTSSESGDESPFKPQLTAKEKVKLFRETNSVWDLFDTSKPWVLVENGSFCGFFDWVPVKFRVGPWNPFAILYLAVILYMLALGAIWTLLHKPAGGWISEFQPVEPYEAFTNSWKYNFFTYLWMVYVAWNVWRLSPIGGSAWISYTLQSWTIIMARHGLCALAPFSPPIVTLLAEMLRFPALITASVTFFIWNFILAPVLLLGFIKDNKQRRLFFGYFTNFRLTQLHVFNIFFAVANGVLVYPTRQLHAGDLCIAGTMVIMYVIWYYFFLDRFGVHLYPIFAPRSLLVIHSWNLVVASYFGGFWFWKTILAVEEQSASATYVMMPMTPPEAY